MKKPTKAELRAQIAAMTEANLRLIAEAEAAKRAEWSRLLPEATEICHRDLQKALGTNYKNLKFEHVDSAGYWYTYQMSGEPGTMTYAVRHTDLSEQEVC